MEDVVGKSWRFTDINLQGLEGLTTDRARNAAAEQREKSLSKVDTSGSPSDLLFVTPELQWQSRGETHCRSQELTWAVTCTSAASTLIVAGQLMSTAKLQVG